MTDRRAGSVGVTVDLTRTGITLNRQLDQVGVMVDLKSIPAVTVSATQSTAATVSLIVTPGGPVVIPLQRTVTQAQALGRVSAVIRAVTVVTTQAQAVRLPLGQALVYALRVSTTQRAHATVGLVATRLGAPALRRGPVLAPPTLQRAGATSPPALRPAARGGAPPFVRVL